MSKRMTLIWSVQNEVYVPHLGSPSDAEIDEVQTTSSTVSLEGQSWIDWLDTVNSFSFHSRSGNTCTIRRERVRQGTYWYGYRRKSGKVKKRYLGRTADLTLARLEEIAAQLDGPSQRTFSVTSEKGGPSASAHFDAQSGTNEVYVPHLGSPSDLEIRPPHPLLLDSKFHEPRLGAHLVERLHLIERLNTGLDRKLTLLSAPAGYGKTTLLSQWLAEGSRRAAWLSLDASDNDPIRFFTYVIATLRRSDARLGASALSLLCTPGFTQTETALTLFINDLVNNSLREDVTLILDDYHVIETLSVHQGMNFLLEHLPPGLHLIIASRSDPPFGLSLLRTRGQLTEVRAEELRFDTADQY